MKANKTKHKHYEPPEMEVEQVRIERGFDVSLTIGTTDWYEVDGGELNVE